MRKYSSYYDTARDFSKNKSNEKNDLPIDLPLLKELLALKGPSGEEDAVRDFIVKWIFANCNDCTIINSGGNLLVTKGKEELYPCVVAHMDEVCGDGKGERTIVELNNVLVGLSSDTAEFDGCPGDDRVGVYVALEMLRTLPACKVAFFVEEEIGAGGGSYAIRLNFFEDCTFILQADRAENDEFITKSNGGNICSKEFVSAVYDLLDVYSYYPSDGGTFTDVGVLSKRGVDVCCVNFGAGYYDNHTNYEKVCISDVENVMNLIYKLCTKFAFRRWDHKFEQTYIAPRTYGSYGGYGTAAPKTTTVGGSTSTAPGKSGKGSGKEASVKVKVPIVVTSIEELDDLADYHFDDDETDSLSRFRSEDFAISEEDENPCFVCQDYDCLNCEHAKA